MKNYQLQNDEVILYRGEINLLPDGKPNKSKKFNKDQDYLTLTNLHLVIEKTTQKLFSKNTETLVYTTKNIKSYNDTPQVIQKGQFVDVYLLEKELFLLFPNKKQAVEFVNAALRLLTGFSKLVRGVKKGQKAIKETEEALNIDIVGSAKTAASVAVDMATGSAGKKTKSIGTFAKNFLNKRKQPIELEENIEEQNN